MIPRSYGEFRRAVTLAGLCAFVAFQATIGGCDKTDELVGEYKQLPRAVGSLGTSAAIPRTGTPTEPPLQLPRCLQGCEATCTAEHKAHIYRSQPTRIDDAELACCTCLVNTNEDCEPAVAQGERGHINAVRQRALAILGLPPAGAPGVAKPPQDSQPLGVVQ